MSISVASTTIKYSRKSGVYTTEIMSPSGDLVQYYKGSDENPGSIYQDFGKLKPKLYLMTISSRKGEGNSGRVYHTSVNIYVNDLLLEFDPTTKLSTTIFGTKAGQFKLISSTHDENYDGIEIQENLLPPLPCIWMALVIVRHIVNKFILNAFPVFFRYRIKSSDNGVYSPGNIGYFHSFSPSGITHKAAFVSSSVPLYFPLSHCVCISSQFFKTLLKPEEILNCPQGLPVHGLRQYVAFHLFLLIIFHKFSPIVYTTPCVQTLSLIYVLT